MKDLEELERELSQKKFADQLSIFGNMVNSDSGKKKFGAAEIFDGAVIPTTQSYNRVPGSRGSNHPKGEGAEKRDFWF